MIMSRKTRHVIYVAGKYTDPDPHQIRRNVLAASEVAIECWRAGWAVICPHKNTDGYEAFEADDRLNWDVWMQGDLEILSRCDAVIMVDNWTRSKGATVEHDTAKKLHITVFYAEDGIPNASVLDDHRSIMRYLDSIRKKGGNT